MKRSTYFLTIVVSLLFIAGCAITPSYLDLGYTTPGGRGPLSYLKPLTFYIKVTDERVDRIIGRKKGGYGLKMAKIDSKQNVEDVIREAIADELRNNRHLVIETPDEADIILRINIEEFSLNTSVKFTGQQLIGTVIAHIRTVVRENDKIIYSNTYSGNSTSEKFISTTAAYQGVMNDTLANFMLNFREDRRFTEALKKYQEEK